MIIYNSMIFLVLILLATTRTKVMNNGSIFSVYTPKSVAYIAMGYIVFWAGIRTQFVDTTAYIRSFNYADTGIDKAIAVFWGEGKDKGWEFLMISFKTLISDNYHWWLTLVAAATGIPIARTLRRYSVNFTYSMYLFITSTTFIWMFNGIRQFLAAAIMFGLCNLLFLKKRNLYIIAVLLCSMIHGTVVIMLPMYFIVHETPFKKRMLLFIFAIMVSTFFISPLLEGMETMLKDTSYASNLEQFAEDDGVNPIRVLFMSIPVVLAFIKRNKIETLHNDFLNVCVNMSTISVGIYVIGIFTSGIMIGRLPIYFSLYNFLLIPYLIRELYNNKSKHLYWIIGLIYLAFYYIMARGYYYNSNLTGFLM